MSSRDTAPSNRALAFLLAATSAVGPFCIDAYLPSMTEIASSFGVPLVAVQQTLTAYLAPFAIMTLWHGAISDAIGRKRMMVASLVLFATASVGCAVATSLTMLVAFRAVQGMTAGAGMVVGRAVVRDLHDGPEAQRMMSLVTIAFAIAPAVAPVLGGWLHHYYGWRSVFVFMAAFSTAVGIWCSVSLPESLPVHKRQPFRPGYLLGAYWGALTQPRFLTACFAMAFAFSGFFLYVLSAPVFLLKHLGVSETGFFWLFGPTTGGMVIGAWLSGRLAGKLSPKRTVGFGMGVMAVAVASNLTLTGLVGPVLPWSVVPLFAYNLGMSLVLPSLTLMALDLFPSQRGLAASCQSFIQSGLNSLTASLVAPLIWATPLRLAAGSAAFFALAALATAFHLRAPRHSDVLAPVALQTPPARP